jgi:hypothetical protein
MEKTLPIYRLVIKDEDEAMGVNFVALVDEPAIQRNFFAFDNQMRFAADKERKIITGALMIADMPIYRRNEKMGEFYVVFDKAQIEKIAQRFMRNGYNDNVNMMHDSKDIVDGVYMYESFITDSQRGILAPRGFENTPEGTWFGSYKVDNEDIWNDFIKTGEFKGFSVEGTFDLVPQRTALESEIIDIINKIK